MAHARPGCEVRGRRPEHDAEVDRSRVASPRSRPRAATADTGATSWRSSSRAPAAAGSAIVDAPLVLIVDDDPKLREYVRVNLEAEGYVVREAGSADEGLASLDEEPPDLILLDVMMPRVDGWEMLRHVQEKHGVGTIPVIMFSGKVDERSAADASSRGAQGFIGKPFDPRSLIESTKQLLPV